MTKHYPILQENNLSEEDITKMLKNVIEPSIKFFMRQIKKTIDSKLKKPSNDISIRFILNCLSNFELNVLKTVNEAAGYKGNKTRLKELFEIYYRSTQKDIEEFNSKT